MKTFLHNPGNYLMISKLTAFVSVDEHGNEGVMGMVDRGISIPFIGADEEIVLKFYPLAKEMSEKFKVPFKIIQLTNRYDITEMIKNKFEKKDGI